MGDGQGDGGPLTVNDLLAIAEIDPNLVTEIIKSIGEAINPDTKRLEEINPRPNKEL